MQAKPACVNDLDRVGQEIPRIGLCLSGPFNNYAPGVPEWGQLVKWGCYAS